MKIKGLTILIVLIFFFINLQSQIPYSESFESGFGIWTQSTSDEFDWTLNSGPTPTPGTGPTAASDGSNYIYIEATGHNDPPESAVIEADFDFSSTNLPIISFDYHMYGDDIGNFYLFVYDGSSWTEVWNKFNNQGNQWHNAKICLGDYAGNSNVKLRFKAETQYSDTSDIALDNIQIVDFDYVSITHTDVTCGGYSDGDITITIEGGFGPYQYSIDDGINYVSDPSTTHTFSGIPGGDYPIRVKDDAGCVIMGGVVTVDEPPTPDITYIKEDVWPCPNSQNGEIEITATGSHTPFEYSINGFSGPFYPTNTFTNLDTGTYQIAVKNSLGCIALGDEVTINSPSEIIILEVTKNDVSTCYGDCNGSIDVTAGGGNTPLSYSIDEGNNFVDNSFFSDLCAGNYRIIIEDSQGCRDTTEYYTINQPAEIQINNISSTNVTGCYGNENGTITIDASGGTGDLLYSINDGFLYNSSNFYNQLPADTYHIWVRDQNNCTVDGGEITITEPDLLVTDSVTHKNVAGCFGNDNGEITIYAHGGTGNLTYSIDSGLTYFSNNHFTGLEVGTYYPIVKDENDCSDTSASVTITQPQALEITNVNVYDVTDCYGASSGVIQIFANNGTPPYQYSVDGGTTYQNDYTFNNLPAGDYEVAVRDDNGCETIGDTYTISEPQEIIITDEISTDVSCYGADDGSIFVDATGGTGDLLYSIDDGNTYPYMAGNITYQGAGTYQIKVRDENGCVVDGSTLTITQPDSLKIDSINITEIEGCYGDSTGVIEIFASGGTEPCEYSIDNGLNMQSSNIFEDLPARTGYLPFVMDHNGCYVNGDPQTIGQPSQLIVTNQSHTNIDTCHGEPVGTITVSASGGTSPIYYSIDNGNNYYDNGGNFNNLYAGSYNIKIKDSHNCKANGWEEVIIEPDSLILDSIFHKDIVCNGQGNGEIHIYAHGGQPQLQYSINGGIVYSYSNQFYNLQPGKYDIVIKDNYNCQIIDSVEIEQPNNLFLDTVIYTDVNTCYGDSSGTITVFAHGGVPEIEYAYTPIGGGTINYQSSNVFDKVTAGSYYVIIRDGNGCTKSSESFSIQQPDPVELDSYSVKDITCNGLNNGEISMIAQGGNGVYEYSINGGNTWQEDSLFTNLYQGTYTLTARDSNLCKIPYPITVHIYEPPQLRISNIQLIDPSCYNYQDGKIIISATGGTSPYTYTLNDIITQNNGTFNNLAEGEYWITITDANNCVAQSDTFNLTMPPNMALFDLSTDEGCSPLTVEFIRDTADAVFYWEFGDGNVSYLQDPTHTYINKTNNPINFTATAISQYGNCSDTATNTITVYNQPDVYFEVDTTTHYYPDTIVNITNINTQYHDYHWNFGDSTTFDGLQPVSHSYPECGVYTISLTARNDYNCIDTNLVDILMTAVEPVAGFIADKTEGCSPLDVNFSNSSSNAIEYEWYLKNELFSTDTNTSFVFEEALNHIVTLKAIGYCNKTDYDSLRILVYPTPNIDFTVSNDTASVNQTVTFINNTTGANYYLWNFGDGNLSGEKSPPHQYEQPGTYDIILYATSSQGCKDSLLKEKVVFISDQFYIRFPTAFSPNGDGLNDYFVPFYNLVDECLVEVYNRRGQIVFRTDDFKNTFWDGKRNGRYLPTDTYVWRAVGKYKSGEYFDEVGEVTIYR